MLDKPFFRSLWRNLENKRVLKQNLIDTPGLPFLMSHHFTRAKEVIRPRNFRENRTSGYSHALKFFQRSLGFSAPCPTLFYKRDKERLLAFKASGERFLH